MTAAALAFFQDGRPDPEIEMYLRMNEYGAQAILGRALTVREARWMTAVGNIRTAAHSREAYRDKDGNENWAEWGARNPELHRILTQAEIDAEGSENADTR